MKELSIVNSKADRNLPGVIPLIETLSGSTELSIFLFKIQNYYLIKELYGEQLANLMGEELNASLVKASKEIVGGHKANCMMSEPGEHILVSPNCSKTDDNITDTAYALKVKAQNDLKQTMLKWTGKGIDLGVGYAHFCPGSAENIETKFLNSVIEARRNAGTELDLEHFKISNRFENILKGKQIDTHYQPIMDFSTGKIMGWEALSRGPKDSSFRSPVMLFELAEQLGRLFALEDVCRSAAISRLGEIEPNQKLFLNIHPRTMADSDFTPGKTVALLEQVGLTPENIVFEITERHSVQDFSLFYRTLEHYRAQGFKVAVDDFGAGHSGLASLAEIQPEFIKIDMSLVKGVDRDPVKRALLETAITFANKIGSKVIAEGIETKGQAVCLMDIGAHCGQGYYLAMPEFPKPDLRIDTAVLKPLTSGVNQKAISCSIPIGGLAEAPHGVNKEYLVNDAHQFFRNNGQFSSLVVTDDDIPIGLIMEYHLNRQLTSRYGMALYYKRPVLNIMDAEPMIVDDKTPIEQAAKAAMERNSLKAYDDIIVTRKGKLYGVISVQKVLNTMAQVQMEMAKGTNPLTGLPGNVAVEQEIENQINKDRPFTIIYADLDNFKVYNDSYGFKKGDGIIKFCADILTWAANRHGGEETRLCHIGGDDFVFITTPDRAERICVGITRCFDRLVKHCYNEEDSKRGWIIAKGRDGIEAKFPLVSISLGIIDIMERCSLMEIGERAANVKKYAKSVAGNSYVRDRRGPLGSKTVCEMSALP